MSRHSKQARGVATAIDDAYRALERICAHSTEADRLLTRAYQAAYDGEVEHEGFGRHLLGHQPPQLQSRLTRARYFVVKWVLEGGPEVGDWYTASTVRLDALYGYALRSYLSNHARYLDPPSVFFDWAGKHEAVLELDYARDLSGGGS